jgi:hypothetical protein
VNRRVCYHEAGHAATAAQFGFDVHHTVIHAPGARLDENGHCRVSFTPTELTTDPMRVLIFYLAGGAAEKRFTGRPPSGDADDRARAVTLTACRLKQPEASPRVRSLVACAAVLADALMLDATTWRAVQAVATALEQQQFMSGHDLQRIARAAWRR